MMTRSQWGHASRMALRLPWDSGGGAELADGARNCSRADSTIAAAEPAVKPKATSTILCIGVASDRADPNIGKSRDAS